MLLAVSFLHMVTTTFTMTPTGPVALLGGYLAFYVFNCFSCAFTCEKRPDAPYGLGLVPLIGIGFHSFIDGGCTPSPFR